MRWVLLSLFICGSLVEAETVKVGAATITVPEGFVAKPGNGGIMSLTHNGKPEESASIIILASAAPAANFDRNFADFAAGATQKNYEPKYVHKGRTPDGHIAARVSSYFRMNVKGGSRGVTMNCFAEQGQKNFVGLGLMTMDSSAKLKYDKVFQQLVQQIKFDDPPAATQPAKTSEDLTGLYCKYGLMNQLNPMGGLTLEQTRDYLMFFPGGFVYRDLPPAEQINKPDIEQLKKTKPGDCGTYSLGGGKLTLSFPDDFGMISDDTNDYKAEKNGIDAGGFYNRLDPQHDRKLNGQYRYFHYAGGNGTTGVTGGVAVERFITLRPNGTFDQQGMASVAMSVESGDSRTGIAGNGKNHTSTGTYKLDGYTMELKSSDGKTTVMTAYLTGDNDSMLVLNDTPYLLPDKEKPKTTRAPK